MTGLRLGASEITAPTLRSRLAQPSSRRPIPFANELSTVEWQSGARGCPTELSVPFELKKPFTPTTALSLINASVVFGAVEVDLALLDRLDDRGGKRAGVDLQTGRQRVPRAQPGAHAAELGSLDRLVQPQRVAPEALIAEGVVAEDVPALAEQTLLGDRVRRREPPAVGFETALTLRRIDPASIIAATAGRTIGAFETEHNAWQSNSWSGGRKQPRR